jgi:hypothetical protein
VGLQLEDGDMREKKRVSRKKKEKLKTKKILF